MKLGANDSVVRNRNGSDRFGWGSILALGIGGLPARPGDRNFGRKARQDHSALADHWLKRRKRVQIWRLY